MAITPSQTAPSGAEVCLCRRDNWVSPIVPVFPSERLPNEIWIASVLPGNYDCMRNQSFTRSLKRVISSSFNSQLWATVFLILLNCERI